MNTSDDLGPHSTCPLSTLPQDEAEALLDAFLEGELPPDQQTRLEHHTRSCRPCLMRLEAHGGPSLMPDADLAKTLAPLFDASMLVAVLGPDSAPSDALLSLRSTLHALGWHVSADDADPLWASFNTSSSRAGPDPVDPRLLERAIGDLERHLLPHDPLGAWLEVGRGTLARGGPLGKVFARALQAASEARIQPGALCGAASLGQRLVSAGRRVEPLEDATIRLVRTSRRAAPLGTRPAQGGGFWIGALLPPTRPAHRLGRAALQRGMTNAPLSRGHTAGRDQRYVLELLDVAGYEALVLWQLPTGWRVAQTLELPRASGTRPAESSALLPTSEPPGLHAAFRQNTLISHIVEPLEDSESGRLWLLRIPASCPLPTDFFHALPPLEPGALLEVLAADLGVPLEVLGLVLEPLDDSGQD